MNRGFTLIELLVAVGIIGVLASSLILVLNPGAQIAKAHDAQRKNDLEQIKVGLDAYYNDNNKYPLQMSDLVSSYMPKLPQDPVSSQSYCYEISGGGSAYRLSAKLENSFDPQATSGITCLSDNSYNYAVASTNTSVVAFGIPTSTPIPIPTSTPTPIPPTPTPLPTPTPTLVPILTYSENFIYSVAAPSQCSNWDSWRASLTGSFTRITIKGSLDSTGVSCTGTTANTICNNLRTGTNTTLSCEGRTWSVATCLGIELSANGDACMCSIGYIARPCMGMNWGGVNGLTCGASSQTITVECAR